MWRSAFVGKTIQHNISVIGSHEYWLRNQKKSLHQKKSFNNLDGCFCFFPFVGQLEKYRKIKIPSDSLLSIMWPRKRNGQDETQQLKADGKWQTWQCLSLQRREFVQWEKDVWNI